MILFVIYMHFIHAIYIYTTCVICVHIFVFFKFKNFSSCIFLSFVLLGPHPWHMEVPGLGV